MSSIKLKHSGGNSVSLNPPTSAPTSTEVAFKLPNADGSANQLLKTDGSGNLGWATDQGGKILQVVQTVKTDSFNHATNTFTDITGMSVTITPSSSSNKIRIKANINYGGDDNFYGGIALLRGSTSIGVSTAGTSGNHINTTLGISVGTGSNDAYKMHTGTIDYIDSPNTTSATTYKLMVYCYSNVNFYLNRPYNFGNYTYIVCGISTITAEEIAA